MSDRTCLVLACTPTDRILALALGLVKLEYPDVDLDIRAQLDAQKIFGPAAEFATHPDKVTPPGDIIEFSFATHIILTAKGINPWRGIPIFPSRQFRHSGMYINTKSGIKEPEDLKGKKIGVSQLQQTAIVHMRGVLESEYGVDPRDAEWVTGAERSPLELPPGFKVTLLEEGQNHSDLLAAGKIDALLSVRPPQCFLNKHPDVVRLFPDYEAAEEAYYKKTGIFPIMHVLAIHDSVAKRYPGLAPALYKAFDEARVLAQKIIADPGIPGGAVAFLASHVERTAQRLGPDYWSDGLRRNRAQIETMTGWIHHQGLTACAVPPAHLFHPSTHHL